MHQQVASQLASQFETIYYSIRNQIHILRYGKSDNLVKLKFITRKIKIVLKISKQTHLRTL